jgi:hypothetical protein
MHSEFKLENLKGRGLIGNIGTDVKRILKWILKKRWNMRLWTGFMWLRIGTSDGLL